MRKLYAGLANVCERRGRERGIEHSVVNILNLVTGGQQCHINRFCEEGRTVWRELRSSFANIDFGVSMGFPSRGVWQELELGSKYELERKCGIIH